MKMNGGFAGATMMVALCFAPACLAEVRLASRRGDDMVGSASGVVKRSVARD